MGFNHEYDKNGPCMRFVMCNDLYLSIRHNVSSIHITCLLGKCNSCNTTNFRNVFVCTLNPLTHLLSPFRYVYMLRSTTRSAVQQFAHRSVHAVL
ncbi:MAG: hypothetical protein [Caudoviricetes sp.]|nr:MAG: hypothetical protein [Caudoviricetes sp.]